MKNETMILGAISVWFTAFYVIIMLSDIQRLQDDILRKLDALAINEPFSKEIPSEK